MLYNDAKLLASPGNHLVPCPGPAHKNPYIDNCGLCAPRWGWVEIPEQFATLETYRASIAADRNRTQR